MLPNQFSRRRGSVERGGGTPTRNLPADDSDAAGRDPLREGVHKGGTPKKRASLGETREGEELKRIEEARESVASIEPLTAEQIANISIELERLDDLESSPNQNVTSRTTSIRSATSAGESQPQLGMSRVTGPKLNNRIQSGITLSSQKSPSHRSQGDSLYEPAMQRTESSGQSGISAPTVMVGGGEKSPSTDVRTPTSPSGTPLNFIRQTSQLEGGFGGEVLPPHSSAVMDIITKVCEDTMFSYAEYWVMSSHKPATSETKAQAIRRQSIVAESVAASKAGSAPMTVNLTELTGARRYPRQEMDSPKLNRIFADTALDMRVANRTRKARKKNKSFIAALAPSLVSSVSGDDLSEMPGASTKKEREDDTNWRLSFFASHCSEHLLEQDSNPGSFFGRKQPSISVADTLDNMRNEAKKKKLMIGQGLAGLCWKRQALDYSVLKQLIADPSYRVDPRVEAADPVFVGAMSVPIFDVISRDRLVAVLVLYMEHRDGTTPEKTVKYLDGTSSSNLHQYLEQAAIGMRTAMRWEESWSEFGYVRRAFLESRAMRVSRAWSKLRIVVRTGFIKRSARQLSDKELTFIEQGVDYAGLWLWEYFKRFRGQRAPLPSGNSGDFVIFSSFCGFVAIVTICGVEYVFPHSLTECDGQEILVPEYTLLIGSFAAVATTIFGAPASPFSQPRVILATNFVGAASAVIVNYFTDPAWPTAFLPVWLAPGIAVAITIAFMTRTGYIHPPAAACSLIYFSGTQSFKELGWMFVAIPVLSGCVIMIVLAILLNNLSRHRKYPLFW